MTRLLLAATTLVLNAPVMAAELVVVMDDLGHSLSRAERVLSLPAPVTLALLPFAPATLEIAARARQTGHEVILHQPMEPLPLSHTRLSPGTLTLAMSPERFDAEIEAALGAVPGIIGVNNHTGSRLTQDAGAMRRLMRCLAQHNLMFLDSRTTAASVAYSMAREARVPAVQRDVFLDHLPRADAVAAEFERAVDIARRRGHAVIIAHPYEVTLEYLDAALSRLPADVAVTSLRRLTERQRPATLVRHGNPASRRRSLGQ